MAGNRGDLLDVTTCTGCDLCVAEDHILGSPAAEGTHDASSELGPAHQHLLLVGGEPGKSLGLATWDQGDLLNGVMGLHQGAHQGMANLVICDQALAAPIGEGLALHAGNDPIDGIINFGK